MCDHCSKVTGQKGYGGQVTCKCEGGDRKEDDRRERERGERESDGRCNKKGLVEEQDRLGGCFASKCCAATKEENGDCCTGGGGAAGAPLNPPRGPVKKSCCAHK